MDWYIAQYCSCGARMLQLDGCFECSRITCRARIYFEIQNTAVIAVKNEEPDRYASLQRVA